jgi:hypothetical protein
MEYKYIYLVFSKTGTWLSRLIGIFADAKYAHSSISLDDSFTQMYSFGRIHPDNPFIGGFAIENLHEGVYKKSSQTECLIYGIRVSDVQYQDLKSEIDRFLIEKEKYNYNFLGLFFAYFDKSFIRNRYYFCSQFISEVLIKSNIYKSDKSPELISPVDLLSIENKEVIYEGYINEFTNPSSYEDIIKMPSLLSSLRPLFSVSRRYSAVSRRLLAFKNNFTDFMR